MEQYLMTQSLLSAWGYALNASDGYEEDAMADFLAVLKRESRERTEAMQNGIDFEDMVYKISAGTFSPEWHPSGGLNPKNGEAMGCYRYPRNYEGACKVAEIIKGAPVQIKTSRPLDAAGMNFLMYGILDALKAGTIYDVKFLNKSMGSVELAGKYLDSPQHPAYFYLIPTARKFQYLVSDGKDLYIETYEPDHTRPIGDIVEEFIHSLESMGLLDTYKKHWEAL